MSHKTKKPTNLCFISKTVFTLVTCCLFACMANGQKTKKDSVLAALRKLKSSSEFIKTLRINVENSVKYLFALRSSFCAIKLFTELSALKMKCGFICVRSDFKAKRLFASLRCLLLRIIQNNDFDISLKHQKWNAFTTLTKKL